MNLWMKNHFEKLLSYTKTNKVSSAQIIYLHSKENLIQFDWRYQERNHTIHRLWRNQHTHTLLYTSDMFYWNQMTMFVHFKFSITFFQSVYISWSRWNLWRNFNCIFFPTPFNEQDQLLLPRPTADVDLYNVRLFFKVYQR